MQWLLFCPNEALYDRGVTRKRRSRPDGSARPHDRPPDRRSPRIPSTLQTDLRWQQ